VFVGFSRIFLLGILIFKELTARRRYKSFGIKGLMHISIKNRSFLSDNVYLVNFRCTSIQFSVGKETNPTDIERETEGAKTL
jgi:hypothetical protein